MEGYPFNLTKCIAERLSVVGNHHIYLAVNCCLSISGKTPDSEILKSMVQKSAMRPDFLFQNSQFSYKMDFSFPRQIIQL